MQLRNANFSQSSQLPMDKFKFRPTYIFSHWILNIEYSVIFIEYNF